MSLRGLSLLDPNDGLFWDFVVPDSEVAVLRVTGAEKAKGKGPSFGDQNVAVFEGFLWRNGVQARATW